MSVGWLVGWLVRSLVRWVGRSAGHSVGRSVRVDRSVGRSVGVSAGRFTGGWRPVYSLSHPSPWLLRQARTMNLNTHLTGQSGAYSKFVAIARVLQEDGRPPGSARLGPAGRSGGRVCRLVGWFARSFARSVGRAICRSFGGSVGQGRSIGRSDGVLSTFSLSLSPPPHGYCAKRAR